MLSSQAGRACAQAAAAPVQPVAAPAAPAAQTTAMPSPIVAAPGPTADETPVVATIAATGTSSPNVSYGVALRLRWVSVPSWMLNLFTKRNVPLSSYATALELMRRKGEFDFIVSVGYQNMSPPDGNWLGRGNNPATDTDYVQFKGLGFVGIDASFVWHSYLNDWFGLHYGAGLGVGIVTGQMLRTSDGSGGCTEQNAGNVAGCHPVGITCPNGTCSDADLAGLNRGGSMATDSATTPHRFVDPNVPPALPIVNVLVGVDFRLPHVRGWEAKIEGGFYDAFFLGGGVGYTF
ncbi:MAG TPA: hypothetical protein VK989_10450 [Polyangia bacterium]|nr:hypothetical protein [Polyangia bacterium]